MNMNESEFENELRALKPAAPSPALGKRIAAQMPTQALALAPERTLARPRSAGVIAKPQPGSTLLALLRGLLWAGAGAAAASAFFLTHAPQMPAAAPDAARENIAAAQAAQPEEAVSELIASQDEGLIYDRDSAEPQRQMRYTWLERRIWTNPQTGAVIELEVPREDVVLMPVAMQ